MGPQCRPIWRFIEPRKLHPGQEKWVGGWVVEPEEASGPGSICGHGIAFSFLFLTLYKATYL